MEEMIAIEPKNRPDGTAVLGQELLFVVPSMLEKQAVYFQGRGHATPRDVECITLQLDDVLKSFSMGRNFSIVLQGPPASRMCKKHLFSYLVFNAFRDTGAETVYYYVISPGNGKWNGPFPLTTAWDMIEEALSDLCDRSPYTYTARIIQSREDFLVSILNIVNVHSDE